MSRKLTRAQLDERATEATAQASLYLVALQCAVNESPDVTVRTHEDGDRSKIYRFDVYRANGAAGGILITTFACPGQSDSVRADYLEQWLRGRATFPLWQGIAADSLQQQARAVQDRESADRAPADDPHERAAARARGNDFEDTGGKDWT